MRSQYVANEQKTKSLALGLGREEWSEEILRNGFRYAMTIVGDGEGGGRFDFDGDKSFGHIPADAPARPLVACKARTRSLSDTLNSILYDVDEHLLEKNSVEMNRYGFVSETEINTDMCLRTQVFEEWPTCFHLLAEVAELQLRLRNLYYFGKAGDKGREGGEPLGFVASETADDARHAVVHLVGNHTDDALVGGFLSKAYF